MRQAGADVQGEGKVDRCCLYLLDVQGEVLYCLCELYRRRREGIRKVTGRRDGRSGVKGAEAGCVGWARGGLALPSGRKRRPRRVNSRLGDFPAAAKFYLDELARPDSIYPRQSLVNSLRLLYPYNGGDNRLDEHVEEFLDTPAHALFAVSILTNPEPGSINGQGSMAGAVRALIPKLHERRALFTSGEDSEALALCLMRAALYVGDVQAALEFSRMAPSSAAAGDNPEYDWMAAICRVLGGATGEAVEPLRRILESKRATYAMRLAAGYSGRVFVPLAARGVVARSALLARRESGRRRSGGLPRAL